MTAPAPLPARSLLLSTLAALGLATVVLLVAVLPAEYGLDPTGLGEWTGFSRLNEPPPHDEVQVETEDAADPGLLHALDATWELREIPVATQEGFLRLQDGEERVRLPLALANLTTVTARLEWNDTDLLEGQRTLPDTFEVSIRAPDGRRSQLVSAPNGPDGRGNVTASLSWRSTPFPREENGTLTLSTGEDRSAVGNWTFVVRLYAAGGLEDRTDVRDLGNNWTLTVTAETYSLDVERRAEREGDRVRLTLAPNAGVEYKFLMEPDQTMRYEWSSTAPLSWDFHGEVEGADPDDFTRYAQGASQGEEGRLTATFAGRHGWHWLNQGPEPVTITLRTSGEYRILGVPT